MLQGILEPSIYSGRFTRPLVRAKTLTLNAQKRMLFWDNIAPYFSVGVKFVTKANRHILCNW
jgi:hypothetical protein